MIGAGLGLAASTLVLAIGLLIARATYLNSVPPSVLPGDAAGCGTDEPGRRAVTVTAVQSGFRRLQQRLGQRIRASMWRPRRGR
jgi:hypothetical protein